MPHVHVTKGVRALYAMALVAALEAYALYLGVDGTILAGALALIAGLGGFVMGRREA